MSELIYHLPRVVSPDKAMAYGRIMRVHALRKPSIPYPLFPIRIGDEVFPPNDQALEILEFAEQIEHNLPTYTGKPAELVASTVMQSRTRFFPPHRDSGHDVRVMINMSPVPTTVLFASDPKAPVGASLDQVIPLEPGDGYVIDNREGDKILHATPSDSLGRTMLQFMFAN